MGAVQQGKGSGVASARSLAASSVGVYRAQAQDTQFDAIECRTALKAALAQNKVLQDRYTAETAANNAMAAKKGENCTSIARACSSSASSSG